MKWIRISLMGFAASVFMSVAAQAQNHSVSSSSQLADTQLADTNNVNAHIILKAKPEPKLALSSKTDASGIIVEGIIAPRYLWKYIFTPTATEKIKEDTPPALLPLKNTPHPFNGDVAVHEPHFVLLRVSFP